MKKRRTLTLAEWTPKHRRKAERRCSELLAGVGAGADHWSVTESAVHLRRPLSETEIATLDPRWLALPAIDPGG